MMNAMNKKQFGLGLWALCGLAMSIVGCGTSIENRRSSPATEVDVDRDGYLSSVDCDDTDWVINPGQTEKCFDGIDNNCNGRIDADDHDCQSGDGAGGLAGAGGAGGAGGMAGAGGVGGMAGAGGVGGQGGCVATPNSSAGSVCATGDHCGLRITLYYNCDGTTHKGPYYEDTNDPTCNCPGTKWYRCANHTSTCAEFCASMGKACSDQCSIAPYPPWQLCSGSNIGMFETEVGSCYGTGSCNEPTPNCSNAWNTHCCCQ